MANKRKRWKLRSYLLSYDMNLIVAVIFLIVFATCLVGLTLMSRLYRKRMERLENGEEETEKHGEE